MQLKPGQDGDRSDDTAVTSLGRVFAPWRPQELRRSWPGLAIAGVIALAAAFVSATYGGPLLLYALFFGLAFHFLSAEPTCKPGIDFASKTLLRTGVALLGAKITFAQIADLGMASIALVIAGVMSTLGFGRLLSRRMGRPSSEGWLSGGAVGICGASAALAISAALPQTKENEKFTLLTVVGVTTLSTIAMVVYPMLAKLFALDPAASGIFIGGTIHDVAQVVGAGYMISNETGDIATVIKLTRVACLVPVVLFVTILFKTRRGVTEFDAPPVFPLFLVGFVWLMMANGLGYIPPAAGDVLATLSRICLVTAIAALGVKTSLKSLATLGWQPVLMLVAETLWIAAFVLLAVLLVR